MVIQLVNLQNGSKSMNYSKEKIIKDIKFFCIAGLTVFILKSSVFGAFFVPTGSMENTIKAGDFLLGNKLVYGVRTPDWIGIPWTDIGFDVPYVSFAALRQPEQGDIIIFKYPRDPYTLYVKRCIAGPGDTFRMSAKKVYVNDIELPLSETGKYAPQIFGENDLQDKIYGKTFGNKDFFKSIRIPKKGDVYEINENTNWRLLIPIVFMDGHSVTLKYRGNNFNFTNVGPEDVLFRTNDKKVFNDYFPKGKLLNPWSKTVRDSDFKYLYIDGVSIHKIKKYTVEQDYYWAMGDNRDNSLDSRYWGFVPEDYILGRALISLFSINFENYLPRMNRFATILR